VAILRWLAIRDIEDKPAKEEAFTRTNAEPPDTSSKVPRSKAGNESPSGCLETSSIGRMKCHRTCLKLSKGCPIDDASLGFTHCVVIQRRPV
jgi:hypothetical protein